MRSAGSQGAGDFFESRRRIKNMLENILGDNEIENLIWERLSLKTLASITCRWMRISKPEFRIILRRNVGWALSR